MTDQRTARGGMVALIAQALTTLAHLYAHGKITITNVWADTGSGPGVTFHEQLVVRADVTGRPIARDALLAGLAPITEPNRWHGSHGDYREWQGNLLTMRVIVTDRLNDIPDPRDGMHGAEFEATDAVTNDRPTCLGARADAVGACGENGPHGEHPIGTRAPMDTPLPSPDERPAPPADRGPAHRAAHAASWTRGTRAGKTAAKYQEPAAAAVAVAEPEPEVDLRPLLALVVDERFGDLESHFIEVLGEPGQSTEDLAEKYRDVPGVVVVPGRDRAPDDQIRESWKRYAIARAIHYFESVRHGERFPTLADALTAVNLWPGRDMLEHDWALEAAQQLVDPSAADADRDPATADAARGRLRRLVPPALRGRGGEVVIR
jgi:hypothetical protein